MRRPGSLLAIITLLLAVTIGVDAKTRVKGVDLSDRGRARVRMSQRQIFDEIGGKARLGLDIPNGLAALTSDLTLPEEVGDVNGQSYLTCLGEAVTAVGNFTYLPLKSRQLKLEVDYHAVEDESRARGVNSFSLDYPLAAEHVGSRMASYLGNSSYTVTGNAKWSQYTRAAGSLKVQIRDPDLRRERSDLRILGIRIVDHGTTDISLHFEVAPDSTYARLLRSQQMLELGLGQTLGRVGISYRDVRVTNVRASAAGVVADVSLSLYNLRQRLSEINDMALRQATFKGVRKEDIGVAFTTMIGVEFSNLDMLIKRRADHFDVDVNLDARKVDQCILGYLHMLEVLEPAFVEAKTHDRGLSAFVKNMDAIKTRRFRNIVIAAANSQDGGQCDFSLKIGFPNRHLTAVARFQYDNLLTACTFAYHMMKLPVVHQAYSLLKVHTTPAGLQGHYLYEAQGPWYDSLWALWSEAARGNPDVEALFPASGKPSPQEGHLRVDLRKSHVQATGWLKAADLPAYARALGPRDAAIQSDALHMRYDADDAPGRILADLYLSGGSKDAVRSAITRAFGAQVQFNAVTTVEPPAATKPAVPIPAPLATQIDADRKFLGVTPWKGKPGAVAGAPRSLASRLLPVIATCIVGLLGLGGMVFFLQSHAARLAAAEGATGGNATIMASSVDDLFAQAGKASPLPPPTSPVAVPAASLVPQPAAPANMGADALGAFRREMADRIQAAWPNYEVSEKDHLELYVVKSGLRHVVDLEPLYYLVQKPNVDRERAVQSFVATLPTA